MDTWARDDISGFEKTYKTITGFAGMIPGAGIYADLANFGWDLVAWLWPDKKYDVEVHVTTTTRIDIGAGRTITTQSVTYNEVDIFKKITEEGIGSFNDYYYIMEGGQIKNRGGRYAEKEGLGHALKLL